MKNKIFLTLILSLFAFSLSAQYVDNEQTVKRIKEITDTLDRPEYKKDIALFFERGNLYSRIHLWEQAIDDYTKILRVAKKNVSPTQAEIRMARGIAYFNLHQLNYAQIDFTSFISQTKRKDASGYFWRAKTHLEAHEYAKAKEDIASAWKIEKSLEHAIFYSQIEKYTGARLDVQTSYIKELIPSINNDNEKADAYLALYDLYKSAKDTANTINSAIEWYGLTDMRKKEIEDYCCALKKSYLVGQLELKAKNSPNGKWYVFLATLSEPKQALAYCKKGLKIKDLAPQQAADLLTIEGDINRLNEKYSQAVKSYEKALEAAPSPSLYLKYARALVGAGDYKKGFEACQKAATAEQLNENKDDREKENNDAIEIAKIIAGEIAEVFLNDNQLAIECYAKVEGEYSSEAEYRKGLIYKKMNDHERSSRIFKSLAQSSCCGRSTCIAPLAFMQMGNTRQATNCINVMLTRHAQSDNAIALYTIARYYALTGHTSEAASYLKRARQAGLVFIKP